MPEPLITGRSENTPWRLLTRVFAVVAGVVCVVGVVAYVLWSVLN